MRWLSEGFSLTWHWCDFVFSFPRRGWSILCSDQSRYKIKTTKKINVFQPILRQSFTVILLSYWLKRSKKKVKGCDPTGNSPDLVSLTVLIRKKKKRKVVIQMSLVMKTIKDHLGFLPRRRIRLKCSIEGVRHHHRCRRIDMFYRMIGCWAANTQFWAIHTLMRRHLERVGQ